MRRRRRRQVGVDSSWVGPRMMLQDERGSEFPNQRMKIAAAVGGSRSTHSDLRRKP